ncbi:ribosome small subunit-dependent GTPase A [Mycoplasma sp. CSL7503-lung]|uniref:ribosome small subunit-dependent GTPase A n=1 Tax=Mycoplasma sp. CSL7503-lung TaxID=536372 RepID=UPI0021D23F23|nr:ribosome small subunit-dependent GTPase A [Mycoplasma sp. CSL7503-lung]MCU4706749.1 ribosome small subunit-dependent GTPase A [Mycoplasma sp. CSL7503-lung]
MQKFVVHGIVAGIYELYKNNETIKLPAAGKLRYQGRNPLVGDRVLVKENQIVDILERENELIRPKVANIDRIFIFMSIEEPNFSTFLVDKYMSIIENKNIEPILCITKIDLNKNESQKYKEIYNNMGYKVILVDNNNLNIEQFHNLFKEKYSVFMGQSGVGKTTTINNLGGFNFETNIISKSLGRGKHTTREVRAISLQEGFLIDTPGFSSLNLNLSPIELAQSYKVFREFSKTCKYRSCLHIHENFKDCAVKQNIDNIKITEERYNNYLKLQNEVK